MTEKQTVKFGDICKEVKLTTKDPIGDGYERYIGLEHLDSGSLKIKRWGMIAEDNPSFTRVFKKGQILIGKRRPYLKKAAIAEFNGICSGDIIVVEARPGLIIKELLPHVISSNVFWSWAIQTSSGSLSPRTKFKDLSELLLDIDSLELQKKKVALFEKVLFVESKVESAKNSCLQLKKSMESLFKPSINFSFSDETETPKGWKVETLGSLANIVPGFAFKSSDFVENGVPLIRIGNLYKNRLDIDRKPVFLPESYLDSHQKFIISDEDILLSMTGTAGKEDYGFVVKSDVGTALLNQRVCKITPTCINKDYLFYYLKSRILLDQLYSLPGGTKQANVSVSQLSSLKVLVPTKENQAKVARVMEYVESVDGAFDFQSEKLNLIYKSML